MAFNGWRWPGILAVVVGLVAGCAGGGPPVENVPPPASLEAANGEASLVVFRDQLIGSAHETRLILDGRHVVTLAGNTFTKIGLVPGTHRLELPGTLASSGTTLEFTVAERQLLFLNAEAGSQLTRTQFTFKEVPDKEGRAAVAGLAYARARPRGNADDAVFTELRAPLPGHGRLYVVRPLMARAFAANPLPLLVDGREVAWLKTDSYTTLNLRPGNHEVVFGGAISSWKAQAWRGAIEAGRTYVLLIAPMQGNPGSPGYIPPPPVGSPAAQGLLSLISIAGAAASLSGIGLHHELLADDIARQELAIREFIPPRNAVVDDAPK